MCTGSATVTESAPRVDRMQAAPDGETHLALSANFARCGLFRPAAVTTDRRLVTCRGCILEMIPARAAA